MKAFVLSSTHSDYQYAVIIGETIQDATQTLKAEIVDHYPETEEQYGTAVIQIQNADVPSLEITSLTNFLNNELSPDGLCVRLILDQLPLILPKS